MTNKIVADECDTCGESDCYQVSCTIEQERIHKSAVTKMLIVFL